MYKNEKGYSLCQIVREAVLPSSAKPSIEQLLLTVEQIETNIQNIEERLQHIQTEVKILISQR